MAVSCRIDEVHGVVHAVFEGIVSESDLLRYVEWLIKSSAFVPGFHQLVDVRNAAAFVGKPAAFRGAALFDPFAASSRWSFVVANELQYGLLRMALGQAGTDHEYDLFFDHEEACAWLGLEVPATHVAPRDVHAYASAVS